MIDELSDAVKRLVNFGTTLLELFSLFGKLLVLVERFLVNVTELGQLVVRFAQQLVQGFERLTAVTVEGVGWKLAEFSNLLLKCFALLRQRRSLGHESFHDLFTFA